MAPAFLIEPSELLQRSDRRQPRARAQSDTGQSPTIPPQSDTGQSPTIVHASLADNRPRKTRRRSSTQASPTFVPHYASVAPAFLVGFDGREPPLGSRGQRTSPTLGPSPALSESPVRHGASPAFVHASPADDRPRKSRKRSSMQASQTVVYATFANSDQNKPHSCSFNWY